MLCDLPPQLKDMCSNGALLRPFLHSYAVLDGQSPRYHYTPHHQAWSSGNGNCSELDPELELWQYTAPASVEDQLLLQLSELSVREIYLENIR